MSPLAVPALSRRQRILRAIAPQPLPQELIPLLTTAHHEYLQMGERLGDIEAKQQTLEIVTNGYIEGLERALPAFYAQVRQYITTAKTELDVMAASVRKAVDAVTPPEPSWTRRVNRLLGRRSK